MIGPGEPDGTPDAYARAIRDMDRLLVATAEDWQPSHVQSRRAPLRRPALWGSVLAAATVGALVLRVSTPNPAAEQAPPVVAAPAGAVTGSLDVESARPFVVMETENPTIAVIWLLEETS